MTERYIGLISGTSMDGIDAVVADFTNHSCQILAQYFAPMPAALKTRLVSLCDSGNINITQLGSLDVELGQLFAGTCLQLLQQAQLDQQDIVAIGSHGQNVCHGPNNKPAFSLQLADPNTIAAITGITTVADFRRRDIALGGQGAPLMPAFHQYLFQNSKADSAIVNIGGIANVTFLPADPEQNIIGFDTGPGNALLDNWVLLQLQQAYDKDGAWAATGKIDETLLQAMLHDPYFTKPTPKSTGREYFNLTWLNTYLNARKAAIPPEDIQTTLATLTATTIANAIHKHLPPGNTVILYGGGNNNQYLRQNIQRLLDNYQVLDSQTFGIDPAFIEATGFAWLARQTLQKREIDLRHITGASKPAILGGVYF